MTDTTTTKPETSADTHHGDGWMRRLARFIIRSIAAIACIMVMLWMAKCPGDLEWWRAIGVGFMIPVISRFL